MPGKEIKGRSPRAMYSNGKLVGGQKKLDKNKDGKISGEDFAMMAKGGRAKRGLYANIAAKKRRIKAGSGEKMRKVGTKGAPTKQAFINSAKTAKKPKKKKTKTA